MTKEYSDQYLEALRGTVSDRTMFLYTRSWLMYMEFCEFFEMSLVEAGSVLAWRSGLVEADFSPNTINSHLSAIKSIFAASVPSGRVPLDVYTQVRAVGAVSVRALRDRLRTPSTILTDELVQAMIDGVSPNTEIGLRDRAILYTLATSGMRIDELVSLKWNDVSFMTRRFTVLGKTDIRPREVPMSDKARDALINWRFGLPAQVEYVFPSFTGKNLKLRNKPISAQAVYEMVVEKGRSLDIKISPHDFRRYVATKLSGQNIVQAQAVLGHKSIMTTQRYVKRAELPSVDWLK